MRTKKDYSITPRAVEDKKCCWFTICREKQGEALAHSSSEVQAGRGRGEETANKGFQRVIKSHFIVINEEAAISPFYSYP
jgi:hypothetical protein